MKQRNDVKTNISPRLFVEKNNTAKPESRLLFEGGNNLTERIWRQIIAAIKKEEKTEERRRINTGLCLDY